MDLVVFAEDNSRSISVEILVAGVSVPIEIQEVSKGMLFSY